MPSYGSIPLHIPGPEEAAWISTRMPISNVFGFFRPRWLGDPALNPRAHFAWFLNRTVSINRFFHPWGASRWGYAFVLADGDMLENITDQNSGGEALPFTVDDNLGGSITTPMFMLPAVPMAKIMGIIPQLPLWFVPLVDERYYFWERSSAMSITEGVTTWTELFTALATGLAITLNVDPISNDYLFPSAGFDKDYQHLPLLLDLAAASVGQRIVRRLDGSFRSILASTATSLVIAQSISFQKFAGGSLNLGVVDV